jgi:hypothetical protein
MCEEEYKNLRVTTMTLIFGLKCKIDLNTIFYLLPITRISYTPSSKARTRYKIPHYEVPGSILSMRYRGQTRGILKTTSGTHFKNSITIDISLKEKNVNIKLTGSKMQMCGAKSVDQGIDGANEILSKIDKISDLIKRINKNLVVKNNTINLLKKNIQDSEKIWYLTNHQGYIPNKLANIIFSDLQFQIDILEKDISVLDEIASNYKHYCNDTIKHDDIYNWLKNSLKLTTKLEYKYPTEEEFSEIDKEYLDFLMLDFQDYQSKHQYFEKIDFISSINDDLYEGELEIESISKAMVNFNYSLGDEIDRFQLKKYINGRDGFFAHFDNSTEHYVTIELPYHVEREQKKRKNKKPCHSFLVYQSGLVTQSGPDEELMKDAYKQFISIFNEIRENVVKT